MSIGGIIGTGGVSQSYVDSSIAVAWTEPHALAGHSIHLGEPDINPSDLFDEGRFRHPAIRWTVEQEQSLPGCGASHLPGAGNRVRWLATQVVEHANDVLTGRAGICERRTFVEASDTIDAAGGQRLLPPIGGPSIVLAEPVPIDDSTALKRNAARS